jgi:hypothetical protein
MQGIKVREERKKRISSKVSSLDVRVASDKDRANVLSPDNKSLYLGSPSYSDNVRQSYITNGEIPRQSQLVGRLDSLPEQKDNFLDTT